MRYFARFAVAVVVAAAFVIPAQSALAHGGRGARTYTATGPVTRLPAPAIQMFGGYDGVPLALGTPSTTYVRATPTRLAVAQPRTHVHRVRRRAGW